DAGAARAGPASRAGHRRPGRAVQRGPLRRGRAALDRGDPRTRAGSDPRRRDGLLPPRADASPVHRTGDAGAGPRAAAPLPPRTAGRRAAPLARAPGPRRRTRARAAGRTAARRAYARGCSPHGPAAILVARARGALGAAAPPAGLRAPTRLAGAPPPHRRPRPRNGGRGAGGRGARPARARVRAGRSGHERHGVHRAGAVPRGALRAGRGHCGHPARDAPLRAAPAHMVPAPAPAGSVLAGRDETHARARAGSDGAMENGRLRIGITCYPVYGGSGVVATELGLELAQRGHEVHFITYAQPFRLPFFVENVYYHEVEVPSYPLFDYPPYSLALAAAMHGTAVRRKLDLLHVHYAVPHATSAWIAREMLRPEEIRVVTTLHGTDITLVGQDPSFHSITRFSILHSDGITAVSEYLRRETVERFDIPADCIEVIPNFVDLGRYRRDLEGCHRSQLAPDGEKIVMHISNFRPVKRVDDVVRVFARASRRIAARLVLVGDGPARGLAQKVAEEEGVAGQVVFLGKQASVAELLACADVLLLPSESEAFGLVALEAMACRSEEHTSELQSRENLVCRLLLEKK